MVGLAFRASFLLPSDLGRRLLSTDDTSGEDTPWLDLANVNRWRGSAWIERVIKQ